MAYARNGGYGRGGQRINPRQYPMPRISMTRMQAPVHINVGGTVYTSSLETLTMYPDSKLSKMFTGELPIVVDFFKQQYVIDRDGKMFRHVLNFLRNHTLIIPLNFPDLELLQAEAAYFELYEMLYLIYLFRAYRNSLFFANSPWELQEVSYYNRHGPY